MRKNQVKVEESDLNDSKSKKGGVHQYKCGDEGCGKFYHSYTAFYNHCKKSHDGQFPKNSLENDKPFEGPTKNRGRPRIKKNQAKDLIQIESMKKQNELIEFMGTLKTKKSDELIVYVQNPLQRVQAGVVQVKQWLRKSFSGTIKQQDLEYLSYLQEFNKIIDDNDLPEFYDPIETHLYPDKLDSYSFSSVYNFMVRQDMRQKFRIKLLGKTLLFKIYLCWSARILSQKLFNEVLYIVLQIQRDRIDRKEFMHFQKENLQLLWDKKMQLKQLMLSFFEYFMKEHERPEQEKNEDVIKRQKIEPHSISKQNHTKKRYFSEKRFAQDSGNSDADQQGGYDDEQKNNESAEDEED